MFKISNFGCLCQGLRFSFTIGNNGLIIRISQKYIEIIEISKPFQNIQIYVSIISLNNCLILHIFDVCKANNSIFLSKSKYFISTVN